MPGRRWFFWLLCSFTRCLAYDEDVGMALAYLEKAVYCGEQRFTEWDVGQSVTKGPKVDKELLRFVTSSKTQAAAGVGKMLKPRGCFRVRLMDPFLFWCSPYDFWELGGSFLGSRFRCRPGNLRPHQLSPGCRLLAHGLRAWHLPRLPGEPGPRLQPQRDSTGIA